MIKTVTTTAGVNTIAFPEFFKYFWIKNIGDTTVYASAFADVSAGVDNTSVINSGEAVCIENVDNDNVYISGAGSVEIHAQDFPECSFKVGGKGGEIPDLSAYAKKTDVPNIKVNSAVDADTVGGLLPNEIAINPNILINPDFKINQKGQSSYTGAVYGVDRWTGIFGGEIVEVTDYGISATFSNNQGIRQFIENSDQYKGKYLTMSVCYNLKKGSYGDRSYCGFTLVDGNSNSIIINTGSNETHDEFVVKSVTGVVPSDASNLFFDISGNGVIGIKWVKLEIGRIVTPFVSPVPAIERLTIQAMDGKINPYVTGDATVAANSQICVTNHGFTPSAVIWWDGSLSGVAVSFNETQFNINIASTDARTVNYLIFK